MHELIVIKYLQDTPGVKVFSQFEDSMLKGCLIRVEQRKENKVRWVVKVDNCGLNVHIDKLNLLMDMLEKHRADIVKLY